ncbi:MAG: carbohydrate ABC transporter permease [Candidatus Lokiarchaeia archaeon]
MRLRLGKGIVIFILCLWMGFTISPFFWALITSLKPPIQVAEIPPKIVFKPDFSNYMAVIFGGKGGFYTIVQEGFAKFFVNSFAVASITTLFTLLLGTMSSYYIARTKIGGEKLNLWILSLRMMPPIAVIIPFYMMISFIGLVDSIFSLILIYTIFNLPLSIWFISAYINSIPKAYDQMALIDGHSRWGVFWRVIVPMAKPAILTSGLLVFIFSWNEFLFALVLTGFKSKTLPVLATGFITQRGIIWGQLTATAIIITVPIFILTIFTQRYLVKGLSLGIKK